MILIVKLILLTSLLVIGYTVVTQKGMALFSIREWAERSVKYRIVEPLLLCHWCQPSVWSLFGFLFGYGLGFYNLTWTVLWMYPLVVAGSSFLCGISWSTYKLIEAATQYFTNGEKLMYFDISDRKAQHRSQNNKQHKS